MAGPGERIALINGSPDTTELPGLNHLVQNARTGSPGEYVGIEDTVAPVALNGLEIG